MKIKLYACLMVVFVCSLTVVFVPTVNAAYPERSFEFVTHGSPGGGSDRFMRTISLFLEKEGIVKQKIIVANRTGGSGVVQMDYIASQKGNPYVLGISTGSPLNTMIRGASRMRYEDLTFVSTLIQDPNFLSARYDAPFNNMKEMIAWAKKLGRDVNLAIGSIGGMDHTTAHRIGRAIGVKFNIIAFKSSANSAVALLGGHTDLRVGTYDATMDAAAKQLKILSINSDKRNPFLPDAPTLMEQGINVSGAQYRGFWAPQDFPPDALKYWEVAFLKLTKTKRFNDYVKTNLGIPDYKNSKEMKALFDGLVKDMVHDLKELNLFEQKKKK